MNYESRIKKIKGRVLRLIHYSLFMIHKSAGFTLIELMVVLSVTAVLSVLGIVGFRAYSESQILQSSANDLLSTLNLARSRALSQVKTGDQCSSADNVLASYKVIITPSNYSLTVNCGSGLSDEIYNKKLPDGVSFGADASFTFPILTGGVQPAGCITLSGYGKTRVITVNSVGGVSINTSCAL